MSPWNSESDNGKRESKEGIEEHHHGGFRSGQNEQTLMEKKVGMRRRFYVLDTTPVPVAAEDDATCLQSAEDELA